jgi:Flp pilus assembly protein TadG
MIRAKHSERGASMAETAIIMSVVLLLLFGIIDFGRATYTYSWVANAARMGARWMIVRGSLSCTSGNGFVIDNCNAQSAALQTYVQSLNTGMMTTANIAATETPVSCPVGAATNGPGCVVKVTVSYPFAFIAPFFPKAGIQMSSTSQMVISQ